MTKGLSAFETFTAMKLHFMRKSYDGWIYNFKTKSIPKEIHKNVQMQYAYESLSRTYPSQIELIKFLYPAFKTYGYGCKPLAIIQMRKIHANFITFIENFDNEIESLYTLLVSELGSVSKIMDSSGTLPVIYELVNDSIITYEQAVLLFLVFPGLNKVSSNEPFVFERFKTDIEFDKRFFSLYISAPSIKKAQSVALDYLKGN